MVDPESVYGRVISKLKSLPELVECFIPDADFLHDLFEEESKVQSITGTPLINRALNETLKRSHHLLFIESAPLEKIPHHAVTMEDINGKTVGFDVPDGLRHETEGRDELIWVFEKFVVDPTSCDGPVSFVLHHQNVSFLDEVEGIADPIIMHPALTVDKMIYGKYGLKRDPLHSSGILSFNINDS